METQRIWPHCAEEVDLNCKGNYDIGLKSLAGLKNFFGYNMQSVVILAANCIGKRIERGRQNPRCAHFSIQGKLVQLSNSQPVERSRSTLFYGSAKKA